VKGGVRRNRPPGRICNAKALKMGDLAVLHDAKCQPGNAQDIHLSGDVRVNGGEIRLPLQHLAGMDITYGQHMHQGQADQDEELSLPFERVHESLPSMGQMCHLT
jgi:hypothetical protein